MGEFHLPTFNFTLRVSLVSQNQCTIINQAPFTESLQLLLLCKPWNIKVHIHFELSLQNKQPEKKQLSCLPLPAAPKTCLENVQWPQPCKTTVEMDVAFQTDCHKHVMNKGSCNGYFQMDGTSFRANWFFLRKAFRSLPLSCMQLHQFSSASSTTETKLKNGKWCPALSLGFLLDGEELCCQFHGPATLT